MNWRPRDFTILTHSKWLLSPWVIGKDCCLMVIWVEWLILASMTSLSSTSSTPSPPPSLSAGELAPTSQRQPRCSGITSSTNKLGLHPLFSLFFSLQSWGKRHPCPPQPIPPARLSHLVCPQLPFLLLCSSPDPFSACENALLIKIPLYSYPIFLLLLPPSSLCWGGGITSIYPTALSLKKWHFCQ